MTVLDFLEGTAALLVIVSCVVTLTYVLGRDHSSQPYPEDK